MIMKKKALLLLLCTALLPVKVVHAEEKYEDMAAYDVSISEELKVPFADPKPVTRPPSK